MEGTIQKGSAIKESKLDLLSQEAESTRDASTQVTDNIRKFAIKLVGVSPAPVENVLEEASADRAKGEGVIPRILYDLEFIKENCALINRYISEME
jgi:hypothetical protein